MIWLAAYIGSIVAINYAFSLFPHLDLVWSCWVGLVFILRDMVQVRFGHWALAAMLAGTVVSYLLADPFVATASVAAFALSETIDWVVFTVTKRPLRDRLWLSAALSVPADTALFFGMLDIWEPGVWAASFASKLLGVSVVWLLMRARDGRVPVAA
ncbi:preQ0 transporter [Azospirillum thermophilum]|uniref:PreQ0 transporter n=1 Tax=Azospirillum thermophilum TaxID=2202148 RepID=A0A2S2CSH9_9PROT|nr:preQ0 transporter [Azospirillum thermophilum]AWK87375.1 preQ0 transporter [Azospirillum thermophilum]